MPGCIPPIMTSLPLSRFPVPRKDGLCMEDQWAQLTRQYVLCCAMLCGAVAVRGMKCMHVCGRGRHDLCALIPRMWERCTYVCVQRVESATPHMRHRNRVAEYRSLPSICIYSAGVHAESPPPDISVYWHRWFPERPVDIPVTSNLAQR